MMKNTKTNPIFKNVVELPTPSTINYNWNLGSLLGMMLMIQVATGIMISMHYNPNASLAFESVNHLMQDVNWGWTMRYLHMNGASLFMAMIFFHLSKGLLNSSYKKMMTWMSGMMIILTVMATAFLGYVLPWGQMSFWGATVITNLVSAIPLIGAELVEWLWGGFSVSSATLNRFYTLHFMLPFMLMGMVLMHLISLHSKGSSDSLGVSGSKDSITFHQYFSWKDIMAPIPITIIMCTMLLLTPDTLGDPENFNPANPMMTPIHIKPEWYFLFAYAILRSIPNKLGGVLALAASIMVLATNMQLKRSTSSSKFSPLKKMSFWTMTSMFILLTWLGGSAVEPPYDSLSIMTGIMYFLTISTI